MTISPRSTAIVSSNNNTTDVSMQEAGRSNITEVKHTTLEESIHAAGVEVDNEFSQISEDQKQPLQPRHICSLGTGEVVHILVLKAKDRETTPRFELFIQTIARDLYRLEAGVTDVRICHPRIGKVAIVITFLSKEDLFKFQRGPELELLRTMRNMISKTEVISGENMKNNMNNNMNRTIRSTLGKTKDDKIKDDKIKDDKTKDDKTKDDKTNSRKGLKKYIDNTDNEDDDLEAMCEEIDPFNPPDSIDHREMLSELGIGTLPSPRGLLSKLSPQEVSNLNFSTIAAKSMMNYGSLGSVKTTELIGHPEYILSGSLMPSVHTLATLVDYLKENVIGQSHQDHDVKNVAKEISKWYPRPEEYNKYIHWDSTDPKKYTRNLIYGNNDFECILMCWPPESMSAIHCHDLSSCWVALVEGDVWEVQYSMPELDRGFLVNQMKNPTGAVGKCGTLKKLRESQLSFDGVSVTYANNDIGVHRVENRTTKPAYTMHVYAPPLRKIKIFKECGKAWVHTVGATSFLSNDGYKTGLWTRTTNPDGVLDVDAWNADRLD